ncbi:MAG: GNAT family N-acetyltransferase [Hyphomicrobiales bacterium]|nr:GNAT family N-acetyltransferase [Hyphomicrobiales bacterium]
MPHEASLAFRPALPEDADSIRALVRSAYAKWVPVIGREPLPMRADYDRAVREHQFDLLMLDGEMVGLVETLLRPDHLWIENLAVKPLHQGRGLGRRLLAHVERHAVEQGCVEARLQTNAAFADNVTLYTCLGYDIYKEEPFRGGLTVYMKKTLA